MIYDDNIKMLSQILQISGPIDQNRTDDYDALYMYKGANNDDRTGRSLQHYGGV